MAVKDSYIEKILSRDYFIYGLIDLCKGKKFLYCKREQLTKLSKFISKVEILCNNFNNDHFAVIFQGSILTMSKFNFVLENNENFSERLNLVYSKIDFIFDFFVKVNELSKNILQTRAYGIFTQGPNRLLGNSIDLKKTNRYLKLRLMSESFKKLFDIESYAKKITEEQKNETDLYLEKTLHYATLSNHSLVRKYFSMEASPESEKVEIKEPFVCVKLKSA